MSKDLRNVPDNQAAAVWEPLTVLQPWAANPRDNKAAIDEVAKSIRRFGWGAPIVANARNGEIIAGHTRFAAAQKLKLEQVPVRWLDLDPADAHALALADNKVGEVATWDDATLRQVLAELKEADESLLADTGFSDEEIELLLNGADAVSQDEWGDALGGLPAGDRAPIQSMTFTLHDDQADTVREAIEKAKDMGAFGDTGNENSNGNAIARVCEMFLGIQK